MYMDFKSTEYRFSLFVFLVWTTYVIMVNQNVHLKFQNPIVHIYFSQFML